jgi:hypothetical protein
MVARNFEQIQASVGELLVDQPPRNMSKFFDRVQHDVLMSRVARKVRD